MQAFMHSTARGSSHNREILLADWRWCGGKHDMYLPPPATAESENKKYVFLSSMTPRYLAWLPLSSTRLFFWRNVRLVSQHMQPCSHFVYGGRRALRFCGGVGIGMMDACSLSRSTVLEGSRIFVYFLLTSTCPIVSVSDGVQRGRRPRLLIVNVRTTYSLNIYRLKTCAI